MRLTKTAIDALRFGDRPIYDDLVTGLHVKASRTKKSFNLYYRTKAGDERRPMLGDCGVLSIAEAREIARDMLAAVAKGGDPAADRKKAKEEPIINDLWLVCEREVWNRRTDWDKEAKRLYHAHIKPRLGGTRVRAVQYPEVHGIHSSLKATPNQANRSVAVISRMLNEAERLQWRDIGTNPCRQIKRFPELKRTRYAKPGEMSAIGPLLQAEAEGASVVKRATESLKLAIELVAAKEAEVRELKQCAHPDQTLLTAVRRLKTLKSRVRRNELRVAKIAREGAVGNIKAVAFIYLLIFSGARPSEIARARWDQLERVERDGEVFGVLKFKVGKNQNPRAVFLPPQAMRVIDRLPKNRTTITGLKKLPAYLWNKVREAAGCPDLWGRDLRRTFASNGLSAGLSLSLIGELLGHESVQTTKIYAKLMEDPAFAAATTIADRVEKMLSPVERAEALQAA